MNGTACQDCLRARGYGVGRRAAAISVIKPVAAYRFPIRAVHTANSQMGHEHRFRDSAAMSGRPQIPGRLRQRSEPTLGAKCPHSRSSNQRDTELA